MEKQVVPGSFSLMKKMNTSLILNTIREKGPISRAEIAKITGLTPATVTNITAELIEYDLILEAERGRSSGGRKPVMLRINSNGYHVIGLYIGSKSVEIIVANLNADMLYTDGFEIGASVSSEVVLESIIQRLDKWIKGNRDKKILGIGVGIHGLVNSREGISIYAPNLGWENVHVRDILEKQLKIPVFIDNDVRTMTLGESWFGVAKDISNFVFVYVGYGIGGSIVIDKQLYKGVTEGAGEVGHTTIEVDGPKCSCGNYGCLQALASEQTLVNRTKEILSEKEASIILDMIDGDLSRISPEIIYEAAQKNDKVASRLIKDEARFLGVGIANLINMFNPALVVLNGKITRLGDLIMDGIHEEVARRSMKYLQKSACIILSHLGDQAVLKGTVALVLSDLFDNPGVTYAF